MSGQRLTHALRDQQLRLAIRRIQRNRAHTKLTKLTISSVAREAGVSTALIHNYHPQIAELIRSAQGRSSRVQRDAKRSELKSMCERNRELRAELAKLRKQIADLSSINEVLLLEKVALIANPHNPKVVAINSARGTCS